MEIKTKSPLLVSIQNEVTKELANKEVMMALISTTFKGLNEVSVKQAITEGMMRGFTFKDFLEKNIYAVPFSSGYSLITSIDYARKIGQKNGLVGKTAPVYEVQTDINGKEKIISCTVTVKKRAADGYVGDFTETVYFSEYTTNKNQWLTKPRTMIAKVAEMHALRQACPEELAKAYVEEEFEKEAQTPPVAPKVGIKAEIMVLLKTLGVKEGDDVKEKIKSFTGMDASDMPEDLQEIKGRLQTLVDEMPK